MLCRLSTWQSKAPRGTETNTLPLALLHNSMPGACA
jgi:hypothetical protein